MENSNIAWRLMFEEEEEEWFPSRMCLRTNPTLLNLDLLKSFMEEQEKVTLIIAHQKFVREHLFEELVKSYMKP